MLGNPPHGYRACDLLQRGIYQYQWQMIISIANTSTYNSIYQWLIRKQCATFLFWGIVPQANPRKAWFNQHLFLDIYNSWIFSRKISCMEIGNF